MLEQYFNKKQIVVDDGFQIMFRNVWADNADAVSFLYSGTGALKTDYTRMGVRTKLGALQDGQRSVIRYIKNNFLDGVRQDGYDLALGTPFTKLVVPQKPINQVVILLILSLLVQFIIGTSSVLSFIVTNILIGISIVFSIIAFSGRKIVDLPKLKQLKQYKEW